MSALRAVIFDVDGTLVDSERDCHRVAFNEAFARAGLPDRWDVDTYGRLLAITGGRHRLAAWFTEHGRSPEAQELAAVLHADKTRIMREMVESGRVLPRPGVPQLIELLAGRGVALHIATTGTRAWVDPLLAGVFGPRFDVVVTGTEVPELKPDPAAYLRVLELTGADPAATVVVEDSGNGVRAAVGAGLRCVVVRNDYTLGDDVTGAELVVDSFEDPTLDRWFQAALAD